MSWTDWLFKGSKPAPTPTSPVPLNRLKFRYEAAAPEHHNLFRGADILSANAAAPKRKTVKWSEVKRMKDLQRVPMNR